MTWSKAKCNEVLLSRVGPIYISRYISMIFSNLYQIYIIGKNQEKIMIFSKINIILRYYPRKEKVIKKLQKYINYIIIVIWKSEKETNKSLFLPWRMAAKAKRWAECTQVSKDRSRWGSRCHGINKDEQIRTIYIIPYCIFTYWTKCMMFTLKHL